MAFPDLQAKFRRKFGGKVEGLRLGYGRHMSFAKNSQFSENENNCIGEGVFVGLRILGFCFSLSRFQTPPLSRTRVSMVAGMYTNASPATDKA